MQTSCIAEFPFPQSLLVFSPVQAASQILREASSILQTSSNTSPSSSAPDERRRSHLLEEIDHGFEGTSSSFGFGRDDFPQQQGPTSSSSSSDASSMDESVLRVVDESHIFASLLPLLLAHLGPVAAKDATASVQVLTMIQVRK